VRCAVEDGVTRLLVDHVGAVTGEQDGTPPVPGSALVLSLDARVQRLAEGALERQWPGRGPSRPAAPACRWSPTPGRSW
jgi:penicillin-binding protein 2